MTTQTTLTNKQKKLLKLSSIKGFWSQKMIDLDRDGLILISYGLAKFRPGRFGGLESTEEGDAWLNQNQ